MPSLSSGTYVPPAAPTPTQRLGVRERPDRLAVGRQRWADLLFAHWTVEPAVIQATLPKGLFVDTFEGRAYVGIVPFSMERVRPSYLPAVPLISWFLELNVRTYVHDARGNPGVWFYSLDCSNPLAVVLARRFFHLPYFRAEMSLRRSGASVRYRSLRKGSGEAPGAFAWDQEGEGQEAGPGTLEFFLLERYLLFASDSAGRLFQGQVHHAPYRFYRPTVRGLSAEPARPLGFDLTAPPASLLAALPVDVSIYRLRPLG